jgi:coniferyl-aldehyde dehydrogenase
LGGPETGQAFAGLPFDHLFYTGSTAVGRLVMQAAAANLTPVTLELGGKSPCILADDANLPGAVESIVYGKLLNSGQTCIAPDYVLLPERRLDEFVKLATGTVAKFYPALAANPDYSSIIDERHYRRLAQYLADAKAGGARVVEINPGREILPAETRKLPPTLIIDPADDLAIMREEIFGPLLPIKTYRELDEAIDYVNGRPRPLALYYFGAERARRDEVLRRTLSGGTSVNTTLFHFAVEALPFGGVGASGIGAYHGEFGFQTFSHRRAVFLQSRLNGAWLLYPPFGRLTDLVLRLLGRR